MSFERPILAEIHPYIPGKPISEVAREYGVKDIVKLASNENPLGPSPKALDALRNAAASINLYPDAGGYLLRQKLSQLYDYSADSIILGNGSTEIVELICEAFLEPGLEAITGPQAFFKYRIGCQIMGVQPTMIPMPNYTYDAQAIIAAINPKTRLVFIANPNNPTGTYLAKPEIDRIIDALPPDAMLVLDEAYYEFVDLPDYPDGLRYVKDGKRVIVLRTFSKAYGLAGIRCGYALAAPQVVNAMHKVREAFNCNSLAQVAAAAALGDTEFLAETLEVTRQGMRQLEEGFGELDLFYVPSVTNFFLVDFKRPGKELFEELLKRGVIIRPMALYGLPTHMRISTGLPREHEKLFGALRQVL